jgi:phosphate-selective porin OprO/OprP
MGSTRSALPLVGSLLAISAFSATALSAADGDGDGVAPAPPPAADTTEARLDALERQLRELRIQARKAEIAQEDAANKAKDGATVKAGADGFVLASNDGSFSLKIGGYAQIGSKSHLTDEDRPANHTLFVNRARLVIDGVLGEHVAFRIMPDFATGQTLMQDAYTQLRLVPAAVLQVGKYKVPVGLERLQSDAALTFIERSLATQLTPNRDEGVQLGGALGGGKVEYAFGVFNGAADNGSRDGDVDDGKQVAARIFATPFKGGDERLAGLAFGVGGSFGDEEGTVAAPHLPNYRTSGQSLPGSTASFFSYRNGGAVGTTTIANGWQWRLDPQACWYAGPYHLQGECIWSAQHVQLAGVRRQLINTGWVAEAGWVVTGDHAAFGGVRPRSPFSLRNRAWGAFEIAARASRVDIDDEAFPFYAAPSAAARATTSYGVALNWYLSRNLKLQTDYEFTAFDQGAGTALAPRDLQSENVIESQLQVSF